jgi:tetratricopeptide (TPR) repeat protein
MWRKAKGETMEAKRFSKVTDRERYYFPAQRATSVAVGVLFVTVLAGAGEPAGRDPNSMASVWARQADRRDGSAHKDAAKALLGPHYQDYVVWNYIRTVSGLSGGPGTEPARQNAEAILGHCQRALALGVKDAEVYWMMGEGYFLQKQYREAIDAGLGALQIRPDFYPALHLLIRAHSREGEYEKALDYCLRALAIRPRGISTPHLSYFYSLCKRLTADGRYATVLSYYEKLAELSSKVEIGSRWPEYDLAKETSHVKYYLNSPIKGYPPTVTLPRTPRFGRPEELSAEEKQKLMAPLNQIAVSCSSPHITVTAVSVAKKGILSQARILRNRAGALIGEVGAFEIEFKGELKERVDRIGDFDPAYSRYEINQTKAEAIKGFLQQAAMHLGIPEYILGDLDVSLDLRQLTYRRGLTYKGVPLRFGDLDRPRFAVDWGSGDLRKRNVFSINSTLYTLPTADIPVEPLVTEKQARAIATEALTNRYGGVRQETSVRPDDSLAGREIEIGQVSLCIQPEFLSFGNTIDTDLFDPVCEFAEYRLLWLAIDKEVSHLVKVDAITGETLGIRALVIE